MTPQHAIYGLVVESAGPLPGLDAAPAGSRPDLTVSLGERPQWAAASVSRLIHVAAAPEGARPTVTVEELGPANGIRLTYDEGIRFHVDAATSAIWSDWDAPLTLDDAMTFLVGPVLGYVLRRRGVLALHASAALVNERLVGFVGAGGAGKSTLVAALAGRGHAVLTDDVLALRERGGRWYGWPAHDVVRLWHDSAHLLFGDAGGLRALSDTWDKRALDLREGGYRFLGEAHPLEALLLLDEEPASGTAPEVVAFGGNAALLFLIGNTYTNYLLDDAERATELRALDRLLRAVPVAALRRPSGGVASPGATARAVEAWSRRLTT